MIRVIYCLSKKEEKRGKVKNNDRYETEKINNKEREAKRG